MAADSDEARNFYDQLRRWGISAGSLLSIHEWDERRLWDLVERCVLLIPTDTRRTESIFDFIANDQLSGLPAPCAGEPCRLESTQTMARFAALYAEHVVVRHPFERYLPHDDNLIDTNIGALTPHSRPHWTHRMRKDLVADLSVILALRPLAEQGIVSFTSAKTSFCPICIYEAQRRGALDEFVSDEKMREWQQKVGRMVAYLFDAFKTRTRAYAQPSRRGVSLVIEGDEALIEHGAHYHHVTLPRYMQAKAKKGRVDLSFRQAKNTKVIDNYIKRIIDDITVLDYHSRIGRLNYLTSRDVDLELISSTEKKHASSLNLSLIQAIGHAVPYVSGLPLKELVKLRTAEGESFKVYRDAVSDVLRRHSKATQGELREALHDIIVPELNKIERTLKNARKLAARSLAQEVVVSAGAVAIGVFGGLLPAELSAMVAAAGGINGLKALAGKIPELWRPPKEVIENRFYFLWKAHTYAAKDRRRGKRKEQK